MRDFLGIGFTTIHTHVRHSPEFTTVAIARRTAVIPVVHYFVARGINALDTPKAPVEIDTTITNATFGITAFQWRIGILDRTHVRLLKMDSYLSPPSPSDQVVLQTSDSLGADVSGQHNLGDRR